MDINRATETAYKNGYKQGIKDYHEKVKQALIDKSFYPVIVKNVLEQIKEEMVK